MEGISKIEKQVALWCKKIGGELFIFCCIPYETGQSFPFQFIPESQLKEAIDSQRKSVERALRKMKEKLEKDGVKTEYEIKAGYVFLESISAIRRLSPSLVLLTPEGGERLPFFIGSNTLRILRDIGEDILFIKSRKESVENIISPVDMSPFSIDCIKRGFEVARFFNSSLHILNVIETRHLSLSESVIQETAVKVQEKLFSIVNRKYSKNFKDVKWTVSVIKDETALEGIINFARGKRDSMLVVGKKGYSLLQMVTGSVVEKVVRYFPGNVWVVSKPKRSILV